MPEGSKVDLTFRILQVLGLLAAIALAFVQLVRLLG